MDGLGLVLNTLIVQVDLIQVNELVGGFAQLDLILVTLNVPRALLAPMREGKLACFW